jgi:hypothetical protein
VNTRIATVFGMIGIIAAILLFAAGPIVASHQALAWGGDCGWGGCGGGYFYGGSGFYTYGGSGFYSGW